MDELRLVRTVRVAPGSSPRRLRSVDGIKPRCVRIEESKSAHGTALAEVSRETLCSILVPFQSSMVTRKNAYSFNRRFTLQLK